MAARMTGCVSKCYSYATEVDDVVVLTTYRRKGGSGSERARGALFLQTIGHACLRVGSGHCMQVCMCHCLPILWQHPLAMQKDLAVLLRAATPVWSAGTARHWVRTQFA